MNTKEKSEFNETTVITGIDVRTCSCDEQHACIKEIKSQAANCISPCLFKFQQVRSLWQFDSMIYVK